MAIGRKTGGGSRKGIPNRVTGDVREAIALMAERNAGQFDIWLTEVAEKDPGKACDIYLRALEYHVPKLGRTEVTGQAGGPMQHKITVEFV